MSRHIISILLENEAGALSRVSGLFSARAYNRCSLCGRSRGYFRFFGICRICLREKAHRGELPGLKKSSW